MCCYTLAVRRIDMRYLVTGATGLVGGHVIDALVARGQSVRALVRDPASAEGLRVRGVELLRGDLAGQGDLAGAVDGADIVVHCAGVIHMAGENGNLWPVNVDGTRRLLEASCRAGLGRFVHISSVAVYGHAPPPMAEDAPKRPTGAYGRSKWAAEEAVWASHAERGLPAVALRPCAIYGGTDRHAWPILSRLGMMRVLPLPRGGRRLLDLVHIADVVDAVLAAATLPAAVGHAYNVTDGERHTYRDILLAYGEVAGRRPAILPVPPAVFGLALRAGLLLQRGGRLPPRVAGRIAQAGVLDLDVHYAIDAARRDLAYRPQVGLAEGLRRTLGSIPERS
jgi:nucleoside-diphosphate-sugar epimerase